MSMTLDQLEPLMKAAEGEHLEFKEAKQNFHFDKLVKYCAALANEGGGRIVLGVTDRRPRKVVGCQAFGDLERTKAGLVERLRLRVNAEALPHADGRVVVFEVPSRPIGMPVAVEGAYWMRAGEDLAPMTPDMLRRIFDEAGPDFSAQICPKATPADLDLAAVQALRARWIDRSHNKALANRSLERLLHDAELVTREGITYAALILLGTRTAMGRLLAQAEVIFEYRSTLRPGPANYREEFREGFLLFYDRLWELINLRNDEQHFQDGMVMHAVPTFSETAIREAVLNAVSHRDYRHPGSVFVRQYTRHIEIVSPGGFPPGITPSNILDQQLPRNRRIAETFARCGLVEHSGQGADRMLEECVRQSKPLPDYGRSDANQVWLTLHGEIQDEDFLRFLERTGQETLDKLDPHDFLILGLLAREQRIPGDLQARLPRLLELGLLERIARGKVILSRTLYQIAGQLVPAAPKDQAREQNKSRLVGHIERHKADGAAMRDLLAAFPTLGRSTLKRLLDELRTEGRVHSQGLKRQALWFPGRHV
ncbi:MAG TPA: ATP-binding protein [Phycisphaerae bacterium]|nr:ATP-binding protein [Phycisphaerae bacterium]HRY69999.1 ATP-binding protein [Phycisphaerae bacterium]HSA27208.1 ATP-binding protein [Phycisphaerae bacterium]